jgi:kinesin family protein 5
MYVPGAGVRSFHFATVMDPDYTQQQVYESTAADVVSSLLNGMNGCLLCYGQTGSGKTYTTFGPEGALPQAAQEMALGKPLTNCGVVVRACAEIFEGMACLNANGIRSALSVQYVQIYQDVPTDLIGGDGKVEIRRDTGQLSGAVETRVSCMADVMQILQAGELRKQYAATAVNDRSSRAHTVFVMTLTQSVMPQNRMVRSQLHLVDLAGSERMKKSKAEGQTLNEAVGINSSLLVLGKCIGALVQQHTHVPYYECKLTTLLKSAFGGNSRTMAIITCHTSDNNADETLQALRFGENCSLITNRTKTATTSVSAALGAIEEALQVCQKGMQSLEIQGKDYLPAYKKLRERHQQLLLKRDDLRVLEA